MPEVEEMLEEYGPYFDTHRTLVFYYKIACLYFGAGDHEKTIDYLNLIINQKQNLRTDLQCYARLLHLIAHYELGNYQILDSLTKSVYRFMAKMENLSKPEVEIFNFLRRSYKTLKPGERPGFEKLLSKLKPYSNDPMENRSYIYLDFISWLESKIQGVDVQDIIRKKYGQRKRST